jgi:hypothetical protein
VFCFKISLDAYLVRTKTFIHEFYIEIKKMFSGGRPEASKRDLNFQSATWHQFQHLAVIYFCRDKWQAPVGYHGERFFKNTCVKECGVGFMPMQRRHLNSLELQKRDKYAQCTELVEWAGGEGGSKDNYKRWVNKVRK